MYRRKRQSNTWSENWMIEWCLFLSYTTHYNHNMFIPLQLEKILSLNHFSFLTSGCHRHKCFSRHRKGCRDKASKWGRQDTEFTFCHWISELVCQQIRCIFRNKHLCLSIRLWVSVCTCVCANQLLSISNL